MREKKANASFNQASTLIMIASHLLQILSSSDGIILLVLPLSENIDRSTFKNLLFKMDIASTLRIGEKK